MILNMKPRFLAAFTTLFALATFTFSTLSIAEETSASSAKPKIKIILVGDSTVNDGSGWGLGFKQFLNDQAECINTAKNGRSSMSFMREGLWTNALALKGDYYLIQFGHNNEPGKPGRSTDMATFVANMEQYVDEARAIGAKPVLVTPLTRRQWDKANPGKIKSTLEPYAAEVRKIAAAKNVPLVDLHARSIELVESLGPEKCLEFSPPKVVDGKPGYDGTHLKANGGVIFARIVVAELRKAVPELAAALRDEPVNANPIPVDAAYNAVVSADGAGTHTNIQSAIAAAPDNGTNTFSILIKAGVYQGQFIVPTTKTHLKLVGEDLEHTVLTYSLNMF
jgi:pectinesterase